MKFIGFIPVRLESTRLPLKALKNICGLPAIVHVYLRCKLSKQLDDLYVVTDSLKIKLTIEKYNGKVILTKKHKNGSERIFEASRKILFDYIINIQGDEVLIDPLNIDKLIQTIKLNKKYEYFIGITPFYSPKQKNVFKAVINNNKELIYCSREDIPSASITNKNNWLKVVFIVGYNKGSLAKFVEWKPTKNELQEPNEFLRIIDNNKKIKTVLFSSAHISLDTQDDLIIIKKIMTEDKYFRKYYNK